MFTIRNLRKTVVMVSVATLFLATSVTASAAGYQCFHDPDPYLPAWISNYVFPAPLGSACWFTAYTRYGPVYNVPGRIVFNR
jgi:hypothetical protein